MKAQPCIITYVGGPTALIEFGGARLLTDPTFDPAGGEYTTGPVTLRKLAGPAVSAESIGAVDCVLLSHDHHSDNLDRAGRAALANATEVITTEDGARRLGGHSTGLAPWGSKDVTTREGRILRIVATPARHGPQDHDRGPVIGFVAFFLDAPQQAVYFSGDTVWYEGVAEIARRFPVRLAILNVGAASVPAVGAFHLTMTAGEAVEAARAFSGARILPLHFEGWEHFSEGRAAVEGAFAAAHLEDRLRWPNPGSPIEVAV